MTTTSLNTFIEKFTIKNRIIKYNLLMIDLQGATLKGTIIQILTYFICCNYLIRIKELLFLVTICICLQLFVVQIVYIALNVILLLGNILFVKIILQLRQYRDRCLALPSFFHLLLVFL